MEGLIALLAILFAASCSSSGPPISVALSGSSAQTDQGKSVTVSAMVANDSSASGVSWSLTGPGSLVSQSPTSVTYIAPAPSNTSTVQNATVSASSVKDPTKTTSIQISVNPLPFITALSLPGANTGTPYSQSVSETGGTGPFAWSIVYGALPTGLNIGSSTGMISGTPTAGGTWYFEVQLTDAAGVVAQQPFLSVEVYSNSAGGNPVPFLNQPLVPDTVSPGGSGFVLTVNGTGFLPSASVNFNGAPLITTFVNQGQLTAAVPAADIAAAGTASITVVNPKPGGGSSNVVFFPISTPEANVSFSNAAGSPIAGIYGPISAAVGDFTGNGKSDLAVVQFGVRVYILMGNGDGTFSQASGSPITMQQPPWDTLPTPYPDFVAVGDFNNSGKLGLAVADSQDANVTILLGNGDGTFTPSNAFVYTAGNYVLSFAVGDFVGNGNLDLAVTNGFGGLPLNILLGYGDGAFNQASIPPTGYMSSASMPAVGDFNGDGKLDLAVTGVGVTGTQGDVVTILLGNGDGTFTAASNSTFATGKAPQAIAAADLNGDGKLDLAITNYEDASVTILLGNGDGTFTPASGSPIIVGNSPDAIAVGDLNGDGKLDLAIANYGGNTLTILLGNGDGTFTSASGSPFPVGLGPSSIAVGDFNGSGRLGLAITNLTGNTVSILPQQP
jgi:FG-GAP-like repeat/Putative Ig domain